jgi:beta-glucosidase
MQEALARTLVAIGKPTVVVLFAGRPLSIAWLAEHVPAILLAWFPGVEAGLAIADVLFGDDSPAGRLPVTFPCNTGQIPIYYEHKNTGRPPDWNCAHAGIQDDKNTSRYLDAPPTPLYPFGHGLSYTTFRYHNLKLSAERIGPGDTLEVWVEVMNTGDRAGDEVAQLYIHQHVASVTPAVKKLRGFQRVHLRSGEHRTLTFRLRPEDLACLGLDLRPVVEPGTFSVLIGGSSASLIEGAFYVAMD